MADIFTVTAPLAIRFRDGRKQIMIRILKHPQGILFLAPFWQQQPAADRCQMVKGFIKGDGPWKIGDAVVTVLGCQGTDPELVGQFSEWQTYLEMSAGEYSADHELTTLQRCLTGC